jgi:hypothetical protein
VKVVDKEGVVPLNRSRARGSMGRGLGASQKLDRPQALQLQGVKL